MSLGERTGRAGSTSWSPPIWIEFGCLFFKILAESMHLLLFIVMPKLLLRLSQSLRSTAEGYWISGTWELQRGALSNSDVSSPETVFVSCKIQKCVSACTHAHGHWSSVLVYWCVYIFHYWVKISTYSSYKVAIVWDEGAWGLFIRGFIGNTSAK